MNSKDFNKCYRAQVDREKNTLMLKQKEYSSGSDKFQNFNRVQQIMGSDEVNTTSGTPLAKEKMALGYLMSKHIVCVIDDLCKRKSSIPAHPDFYKEKISDTRNYLAILEAMCQEEWEAYSGEGEDYNIEEVKND